VYYRITQPGEIYHAQCRPAEQRLILCACHANGHAEAAIPDSGPAGRELPGRRLRPIAPSRIARRHRHGGALSVRAEGSAASLDRLEIVSEGGQLRIGMRSGTSWSWFSSSHRGITVHVTVLAGRHLAGSGDIASTASPVPASPVRSAARATSRSPPCVAGNHLLGHRIGGITAAGTSQHTNASVTGSGDIDLSGLEATDATLAVVGSGDVSVRATGTAAIDIRGSGDVTVTGPARCTISKSGSGEAHCNG
jgi:hypothetical protein